MLKPLLRPVSVRWSSRHRRWFVRLPVRKFFNRLV